MTMHQQIEEDWEVWQAGWEGFLADQPPKLLGRVFASSWAAACNRVTGGHCTINSNGRYMLGGLELFPFYPWDP